MESNALCHHMKIDNKASEKEILSITCCTCLVFTLSISLFSVSFWFCYAFTLATDVGVDITRFYHYSSKNNE